MRTYNWGILGPGNIAQRIIRCFPFAPHAKVLAVASQTPGKAAAFAKQWQIPRQYESYLDLVQDPDIDIVYVATPNSFHRELAMLAMNHGKHVLVEKPFAMNACEAEKMIRCARENQVFLMEGMWTRFFPAIDKVMELIQNGTIGQVNNIQADFAYRMPYIPDHRMYLPELGGGSLMDVGIYCLSLAAFLYGQVPAKVSGIAHLDYGVDLRTNFLLDFPCGGEAACFSSCDTTTPTEARIFGEKGWISIPRFYAPDSFTLHLQDTEETQTFSFELQGEGFQYELQAVMACIDQGLTECPRMPWTESVALMSVMDDLRSQIGLKFPTDHT